MSSLKTIPSFDGSTEYAKYKKDVTLWCRYTELDEEKRGAALVLHLSGRPREIADSLDPDVLFNVESRTTKSGPRVLIELLDEHYSKSEVDVVFDRLCEFMDLRRGSFTMSEYTSKFSSMSSKLLSDGIFLSGSMLSLMAIKNAELSSHERALVFTLMLKNTDLDSLSLDETLRSLRQLFSNTSTQQPSASFQAESVAREQNNYGHGGKYRPKGRGKARGKRFRSGKGKSKGKHYNSHDYHNPSSGYGMRYDYNKGSYKGKGKGKSYNWYSEESDSKATQKGITDEHQVEFTHHAFTQSNSITGDHPLSAILDIGCTFNMISLPELRKIEEKLGYTLERHYKDIHFTFADGSRSICKYTVKIPVRVAQHDIKFVTAVLEK